MDQEMPLYFRYWGKAKRDLEQDGPDYHLLPYHCLDVAAVGWMLLTPTGDLCKRLASALCVEPKWLQKFFTFCLCLHDLGKFARAFQGLAPNLSMHLVPADPRCIYRVKHDALGQGFWIKAIQRSVVDILPKLHHKMMEDWLSIVFGHHGQPIESRAAISAFRAHTLPADEIAAEQFFRDVTIAWLPDIDSLKAIDKKGFKQVSWQLAGVAVLADWLGSDQHYFKYHSDIMPLGQYWQAIALPSAEQVLSTSAFTIKSIQPFSSIRQQFDFVAKPTPLQACTQQLTLAEGPQLFILEDVTGAGKTEAAMVLVHRLMAAGQAKGLYVGLPTMATANAMYERLSKSYHALYNGKDMPSIVLAHGASRQSEAFAQSVKINKQLSDKQYDAGDTSASAYCNQWLADNRKKALLADVGVGTIDQALLGVLPARHQSLRLLGLADKVLLVDEVHAFDPYMQRLLEVLLEMHAAQGGSAILLSATLPYSYRQRFVDAFQCGLGIALNNEGGIEIKDRNAYPLVTHVSENNLLETPVETRDAVKRTVLVKRLDNERNVLEKIKEAVAQGQCVCWIRNTVKDARSSYQQLAEKDWLSQENLTLFHSRYVMKDRQNIEQDVLARFGKNSSAKVRNGQVLVATQVVEQSLDLDFDVMISDLAPIDLLIQRAGRLQRHCRGVDGGIANNNQEKREPPCLFVLSPDPSQVESKHWLKQVLPGTAFIYPNIGELWRGMNMLEKQECFSMPADARYLIESVYGSQAEDIPEVLEQASMEAFAEQKVGRSMGEFNVLKLAQGYSYKSAAHNGGWDEDVRIPTRLGVDTVDVVLAKVKGEELVPYADEGRHRWALSQIKVPQKEWEQAKKRITEGWKQRIDALRQQEPALRWVEVWPWIDELKCCYNSTSGWNLTKEKI